jgi:predicted pyridoxine 5'-phosphate oxidase superfamily flavin-nucleotide-binding protein
MDKTYAGFHPGELAVQRRAGLEGEAARLERLLGPPSLDGGMAAFLSQRRFAAVTARDADGRLWTSPVLGAQGFLRGRGTAVTIGATPAGPLARPPAGQRVGLIAVEFGLRRRVRVNGRLVEAGPDALVVEAEEAFGNCPSYIQRRTLQVPADPGAGDANGTAAMGLTDHQRTLIHRADTFFLGTAHPDRGPDTSHKGGEPGFVRIEAPGIEGESLWWPDYAGNNMFNSLGNLDTNPEAALLFLDFGSGVALHLSGTAALEWVDPGAPGDDGGTGRRVRFVPDRIVETTLPLRGSEPEPSPDNPALRAT